MLRWKLIIATVFWVISPPEAAEWRMDRQRLVELLTRDWPGIALRGPDSSLATRDVIWEYRTAEGVLEGSQDRDGRAQYLNGPNELISRYAAWFRRQVPATQPLILCDESYSMVVELKRGDTEDVVQNTLEELGR